MAWRGWNARRDPDGAFEDALPLIQTLSAERRVCIPPMSPIAPRMDCTGWGTFLLSAHRREIDLRTALAKDILPINA